MECILLMKKSSFRHSYSTTTLLLARMDYHLLNCSSVGQFTSLPSRINFRHFRENGNEEAEKLMDEHQEKVEQCYNQHSCSLPEIHISSNVAIQNGDTKCWDMYDKITHIDPYRHYYIKTSSGRVLVPLSIPDHNLQNEPL